MMLDLSSGDNSALPQMPPQMPPLPDAGGAMMQLPNGEPLPPLPPMSADGRAMMQLPNGEALPPMPPMSADGGGQMQMQMPPVPPMSASGQMLQLPNGEPLPPLPPMSDAEKMALPNGEPLPPLPAMPDTSDSSLMMQLPASLKLPAAAALPPMAAPPMSLIQLGSMDTMTFRSEAPVVGCACSAGCGDKHQAAMLEAQDNAFRMAAFPEDGPPDGEEMNPWGHGAF